MKRRNRKIKVFVSHAPNMLSIFQERDKVGQPMVVSMLCFLNQTIEKEMMLYLHKHNSALSRKEI